MSFFFIAPAIIFSHSGKLAGIILPQPTTLLASNIGPMLAQYWAQYCPNVGSATQRQYWPILLTNIGPLLAINIGPILVKHVVQYWAQYCPNIGSATLRQYWPMLAINIGPILVKHVVQYWPNIVHNIAPILASLHTTILGKNCHDINGSYTLRLSANIAEQYRAGLDHIGNNTRPNISYIRFQIYLHFQNRSYIEA